MCQEGPSRLIHYEGQVRRGVDASDRVILQCGNIGVAIVDAVQV